MTVYIKNVDTENRAITLASDHALVDKEYIVRPHRDNTNPNAENIKWVIATATNNRQIPMVGEDELTDCNKAMRRVTDRLEADEKKYSSAENAVTQETTQIQNALAELFPDYDNENETNLVEQTTR